MTDYADSSEESDILVNQSESENEAISCYQIEQDQLEAKKTGKSLAFFSDNGFGFVP